MSDEQQSIEVTLEQVSDYEFRVRFDDTAIPDLVTDETPPLGHDAGPNPSRMLAVAVANCLSASLLFALRKYKNEPSQLGAKARATLARNEHGRWRVVRIAVELSLSNGEADLSHLDRALAQFEDFCIVTESVRQGVPVDVSVRDSSGTLLHAAKS
ncbi:OsmC family protein [Dyella subtropica]|uniref:OsmC family protein n=1 Tax=Dyella subtropica TaxID=2992127 RepID=UPI00225B42D4|nr:OsmC family protein [Dyella subtropica]